LRRSFLGSWLYKKGEEPIAEAFSNFQDEDNHPQLKAAVLLF